eukprot:IDg1307t1
MALSDSEVASLYTVFVALLCEQFDRDVSYRIRSASIHRDRQTFEQVTASLSSWEFRRAFRLSRSAFYGLVSLLGDRLVRDIGQASRSTSRAISPATRLGITLSLLSGASYLDQMISFKVGRSSEFSVFHDTVNALMDALSMPEIPLRDGRALRNLASGFHTSRQAPSPLYGCIASVDGIAVAIEKPLNEYVPRNYYCHNLEKTPLLDGFWIAGDAAYRSPGVIAPWSGAALRDDGMGLYRDAFNFYHSSMRIHVEQAFSMLVRR